MNEQIQNNIINEDENVFSKNLEGVADDDLDTIAHIFGLKFEMPEEEDNPVLHKRIVDVCKSYADAEHYQCESPRIKINERLAIINNENRRSIHNKLCIMMLGKSWQELDKTEKDRISNFVHSTMLQLTL
ncbi:MAG: hypothetical protein PF572_05815 [Patescibacteria group bacterium]|jgi:hypothetical protein|nr:hypothetical protein [Patescibacteria group bacterium]